MKLTQEHKHLLGKISTANTIDSDDEDAFVYGHDLSDTELNLVQEMLGYFLVEEDRELVVTKIRENHQPEQERMLVTTYRLITPEEIIRLKNERKLKTDEDLGF
jgi:hypothetical protein